jgi:hypothetical protein
MVHTSTLLPTSILHNMIAFLSLSYVTPSYVHISAGVTFLKYVSHEDAETYLILNTALHNYVFLALDG